MLKSFHLTSVFFSILFILETAFSLPLTASFKYLVVPSSDTDKLVCYMQTADGRTLNLDNLCINQLSDQSQILIGDLKYDGATLSGSVINKTNKTLYLARVNYEVLGKDGSVIESGTAYTEPSTLSPSQTATFQTSTSRNGSVRTTSVQWDE